ncbi:hypothetical protein CGCA056_v014661 [Colletotrichum aenigma]|uniref:uncharacterized protein n=1 Tax=Colletotrichum aenigma TaxID=1215731 RepID=UPI001872EC44|nr:uncharacterized protein CGCA056_v014661 [Colletotrichum aenigma]KAF5502168.1 hypothetical protein CGCA056_v014661 [Colletotrichum aenigma]
MNIGTIFAVANSGLYGETDEHNTTQINGNQQMPAGRLSKGPKPDVDEGRLLNATVSAMKMDIHEEGSLHIVAQKR